MRGAIRALKPKKIEFFIGQTGIATEEMEEVKTVPTIEKSPFARKLREKFAVCVEVIPPKSISIERTLERVEILRARGVDVVNIPDGPRASMRMSPIALAAMIENRTKMETILHYTCRDRNILGMQSDLLGAHILGLRNFLIVTGDPPKLGDYPDATAVYDVDSVGLVKILTKFNNGKDIVGNPAGKPAAFHIGVGTNPGAINIQLEKERLEEKIKGGAEFILTQPVYSARVLDDFLSSVNIQDIPVLVGILPLASLKMAEFLTYEVPGMAVPEPIRDRLRNAGTKEAEKEIGIEVAREALKETRTVKAIKGVYIMLPAGGIETAFEIIKVL
jgi:homocysteine S-methyltransferase